MESLILSEPSGRVRPGSVGPHGDTSDEVSQKLMLSSLAQHEDANTDDEDEDADETFPERLLGLTEMFPESVCNFLGKAVSFSAESTKWLFHVSRIGLWVIASSATILALPVMFENERTQMEEQQMQQQRQILLGPNAAMSGHMAPGMGAIPLPQVIPPSKG